MSTLHTSTGREIRLVSHPDGPPTLAHFSTADSAVTDPRPGQVLVSNLFMSIDPGMALRMRADQPIVGYEPGHMMFGDAVGEVLASADPSLAPGDLVRHQLGWREYAQAPASQFFRIARDAYPSPSYYLGFGLGAYAGLVSVAGLRAGDTVFVSSAAGATGGLAGQLARLLGAGRVIGSAGSPSKVAYLTERLGFDAAFDHHDGPVAERLREAAPKGIDVFFDNVGGEQLRAALEVLNPGGRVALHGALALDGLADLSPVIAKKLTLRGFAVGDHMGLIPEFGPRFRTWLGNGDLVYDETVIDGLDQAPQALLDVLDGRYTGKVVVRLI